MYVCACFVKICLSVCLSLYIYIYVCMLCVCVCVCVCVCMLCVCVCRFESIKKNGYLIPFCTQSMQKARVKEPPSTHIILPLLLRHIHKINRLQVTYEWTQ